jgi:DNA repair protein RecO (recombination protein O)
VVLHAFPYGETSKIVRLATPGHGVLSAIAKGAMRPRSPFGARLQVLSQGTAQVYLKHTRDLQTLAGFDVAAERGSLARDLERFAAASVVAELVLRCSPADPQPRVFAVLSAGLNRLSAAPVEDLGAVGLASIWWMISMLGFSPSLDRCARDGRPVERAPAPFSVTDGGFLCHACARGAGKRVPLDDRRALEGFVQGDGAAEPPLTAARARAHRQLAVRFVRHHLAEGRDLKALAFWEALP